MEVKNKQLIAAIELYKSAESDTVRDQAIGIMESMAGADDVSACLILGINFDPTKEKGFTRRDEGKALEWYSKAADLGDAKGANEAAILYFRGSPELRDKELAEKYIRRAVELAPDNEVYKKNYDVIVEKPKEDPPEPDKPDETAEESADGAEGSVEDADEDETAGCEDDENDDDGEEGEKPVMSGHAGGLLAFNLTCGVIIVGLAVLFILWHLDYVYLAAVGLLLLFALYFNFRMQKCAVNVTTKRVTGRCSFQRMIDIPMDSVTSVGTCSFGGVKVTAASCRAAFYLISNADDVRSAVAQQLIDRQDRALRPTVICKDSGCSYADELTKLSELVDAGFVTQDEFEELKDEIIHA